MQNKVQNNHGHSVDLHNCEIFGDISRNNNFIIIKLIINYLNKLIMTCSQGGEEIVEAASADAAVKELGPSLAEELMHETMSSESSSGKCLSLNLFHFNFPLPLSMTMIKGYAHMR